MNDLQQTIDAAWERRTELSANTATSEIRGAVDHVIAELDAGRLRVAEKQAGIWITHQWVKKAVLLSFRLADNAAVRVPSDAREQPALAFYDKVATKFAGSS